MARASVKVHVERLLLGGGQARSELTRVPGRTVQATGIQAVRNRDAIEDGHQTRHQHETVFVRLRRVARHGDGKTSYNFQGNIDDVRVYDRALAPLEIVGLAAGGN